MATVSYRRMADMTESDMELLNADADEDAKELPGRLMDAVAALENFQEAGIAPFVDARLGNAHELVKTLPGPFDFVFSDADKDWYTQYFKDVEPKLAPGACFTAHNVNHPGGPAAAFLEYVRKLPGYETTVAGSSEGVSISFKRR